MPRPTKQEIHQALTAFATDVLPIIHDKLTDDITKSAGNFQHDGWYYLNFQKQCWDDGFTEILIERFDVVEGKPLLRKKGQIREICWIYREGENCHIKGKHKGKDTGFIYNGYSFQDFQRRKS
jgi:hypothetical protein